MIMTLKKISTELLESENVGNRGSVRKWEGDLVKGPQHIRKSHEPPPFRAAY